MKNLIKRIKINIQSILRMKLSKYKWYRMRHLRDFIPEEYLDTYDNINRGMPVNFDKAIELIKIVDEIKGE